MSCFMMQTDSLLRRLQHHRGAAVTWALAGAGAALQLWGGGSVLFLCIPITEYCPQSCCLATVIALNSRQTRRKQCRDIDSVVGFTPGNNESRFSAFCGKHQGESGFENGVLLCCRLLLQRWPGTTEWCRPCKWVPNEPARQAALKTCYYLCKFCRTGRKHEGPG